MTGSGTAVSTHGPHLSCCRHSSPVACCHHGPAPLQEHVADPVKGWRAKDCAVYLVMAVTVRGKTGELGATTTNRLVNISDFFTQQVRGPVQCSARVT